MKNYFLLQVITVIQKVKMGQLRWAGCVVGMDLYDSVKRLFLYTQVIKEK